MRRIGRAITGTAGTVPIAVCGRMFGAVALISRDRHATIAAFACSTLRPNPSSIARPVAAGGAAMSSLAEKGAS